jgi:hypothetical protein
MFAKIGYMGGGGIRGLHGIMNAERCMDIDMTVTNKD